MQIQAIKEKKPKTQPTKQPKQDEIKVNEKNEKGEMSILDSYKKAGQIAKQVKEFSKNLIKPNMPLVEIAEKIEAKILELGGEIAFPVNLSIDDVAAHYTPTLRDETKANGLLKVDLGVHINGFICDIAFSLDLTSDKKYTELIKASEEALKEALEIVKKNKEKTTLNEIGFIIRNAIEKKGFIPIVNLSGHGLDQYDIHSGITIPNYNNESTKELGEGAFAIEPFSTLKEGTGAIYDFNGGNIYHITNNTQQLRDNFAREVLQWIIENKQTLPFSQREVEKKFGTRALSALSNLKRAGAINEFSQLLEKSHKPISQAETSFIIYEGKVEVLCD
jgi:methionyl aminopeptidase